MLFYAPKVLLFVSVSLFMVVYAGNCHFFFFFFAVPIFYCEGSRDVGGMAHLGGSHSVLDTLQTDCQPEYLVRLGPVEISSLSCSV